jgi:P-type Cu+ transporter
MHMCLLSLCKLSQRSVIMVVLGLAKGVVNTENLFFETSAMLLSFILLGKLLELVARRKASDAVSKLMNLR